MSDTRVYQRSFGGGEITPELFGRIDLTKNQTGLALCRNMRVLPHGPVVNREGTAYINETKLSAKKSRLIPFTLSDSITYLLEFGDQYIRFHTNGGTVLEATKTITGATQANPGVITSNAHGFSNGQWVYLAVIGGMTQLNGRFFVVAGVTANTFTLTDPGGTAINTTSYSAYTSGGTAARVYEIASPYLEADVFDLHYAQSTVKLTITHQAYAPRELVIATPTSWALNTINFNAPVTAPTACVASVGAGGGAGSINTSYVATAVDADGNESIASPESHIANTLWTAGDFNIISCTNMTQFRYNFYGALGNASGVGVIHGFMAQAAPQAGATSPFILDFNIAPDFTRTPPENQVLFASANNYPAATSYFEQRRVFAGSNNDPQTAWLTRSGSDQNMAQSFPLRDDGPFDFKVASREATQIKHIVPLEDLLLFSGFVVWRVFSVTSDALTASSTIVRPVVYTGTTNVQPASTGKSILFEEARSGHIVEIRYSWQQNGYDVKDTSLMAPHLFDGYTMRDLSFSSGRLKTAWVPRSDGVLLGMTYIPEQEVLAWHWHDTSGGTFESVATIQEGTDDGVYFIVKRTINSRIVRYIERLKLTSTTVLADSFYVDAGLVYSGVATSTISGLYHLEGAVVSILADGAEHAQKTVTSGSIALDTTASKVIVGLPITADIVTLPPMNEIAGLVLGQEKNVTRVSLRVVSSSSLFAGTSFTKLREFKQQTTEPFGSPPSLITGSLTVTVDGAWNKEAQVYMRHVKPLPLKILSSSIEVALGG